MEETEKERERETFNVPPRKGQRGREREKGKGEDSHSLESPEPCFQHYVWLSVCCFFGGTFLILPFLLNLLSLVLVALNLFFGFFFCLKNEKYKKRRKEDIVIFSFETRIEK